MRSRAYFGQALFALSVGIERSCKLVLVSDHALRNHGQFPDSKTLRSYGHDLVKLLGQVEVISAGYADIDVLAKSPIHESVVNIVSTFAKNVTRYYNLEILSAGTLPADEPASAWFSDVTVPILMRHVRTSSVERVVANAELVDAMLSGVAQVRFHLESDDLVTDVFSASARTGLTELTRPWERMYVLRIARYLSQVLSAITYESYQAKIQLPHFPDFFGLFNNDDRYFRSRKGWSIYGL